MFKEGTIADDLPFHGDYTIMPGTLGMTVDYLSRSVMGIPVVNAFDVALTGAAMIGAEERLWASELASELSSCLAANGLSDVTIDLAIRLSRYDAAYRSGAKHHHPDEGAKADQRTLSDIRTLVRRTVSFFSARGGLVDTGVTFEGGYTDVVDAGNADFLTTDTLWDLKTSATKPRPKDTLQLAMYALLARRCPKLEFQGLSRIGIFNPRILRCWTLDLLAIDGEILAAIAENVMGIGSSAACASAESAGYWARRDRI